MPKVKLHVLRARKLQTTAASVLSRSDNAFGAFGLFGAKSQFLARDHKTCRRRSIRSVATTGRC